MADAPERFAELMRGVRAGSREAAARLVAEFGDPLRRALRRRLDGCPRLRPLFDSADFSQMAWAGFWALRGHWPEFCAREQLAGFLLRIGRRRIYDERRRFEAGKRCNCGQVSCDGAPAQGVAEQCVSLTELAIFKEELDRLLEKRPPLDRRMVELRAAGHECREIAAMLGRSEGHVRRVLREIRRELID